MSVILKCVLKKIVWRYCSHIFISVDGSLTASSYQILPSGYWWSLLYASCLALLCLLVCLVGAHIYAKATFLIFLVVMFVLATIFISFFAVQPRTIALPSSSSFNPPANGTGPGFPTTANFTGFKLDTLLGNLWGKLVEGFTRNEQDLFSSDLFWLVYLFCSIYLLLFISAGGDNNVV